MGGIFGSSVPKATGSAGKKQKERNSKTIEETGGRTLTPRRKNLLYPKHPHHPRQNASKPGLTSTADLCISAIAVLDTVSRSAPDGAWGKLGPAMSCALRGNREGVDGVRHVVCRDAALQYREVE